MFEYATWNITCTVAISWKSSQSINICIIARAASRVKAKSLDELTALSSLCLRWTTCKSATYGLNMYIYSRYLHHGAVECILSHGAVENRHNLHINMKAFYIWLFYKNTMNSCNEHLFSCPHPIILRNKLL